jgi:hypothetical protein
VKLLHCKAKAPLPQYAVPEHNYLVRYCQRRRWHRGLHRSGHYTWGANTPLRVGV